MVLPGDSVSPGPQPGQRGGGHGGIMRAGPPGLFNVMEEERQNQAEARTCYGASGVTRRSPPAAYALKGWLEGE